MPEPRHRRGLIDTSVAIELPEESELPSEVAISAITLAELGAGPHATTDSAERAARQDRLQRIESTFEAIPFDSRSARAYGRVYSAIASLGRKARGRRAIDLLIASTAIAEDLLLYTRNPDDFAGLEELVDVVRVGVRSGSR